MTLLLPFPPGCVIGRLVRREKRFFVHTKVGGHPVIAHTNNTGTMLGLLRPGTPVFLSPASNPARRLKWTLEMIWCGVFPLEMPLSPDPNAFEALPSVIQRRGFWVGVNTCVPNRLLEAAFRAGKLPWAEGYHTFSREKTRGESRLDGLLEGPGLPRLWVECKNVTLAEDNVALFPDAISARGLKHLGELQRLAMEGERAASFYVVQRPDAHCFGPAEAVDSVYSRAFYAARTAGVESHAHFASLTFAGIALETEELPVIREDQKEKFHSSWEVDF